MTSGQRFAATSAQENEVVQVVAATVDARWLGAWYLAVVLGRLWVVIYAKRTLRRGIDSANMRSITRHMAAGKVAEGLAWGSLGWIVVQEATSPAAMAMLLGVMAAISSNAVSLLAPIRSLYVALILPMLLLTGLRFLSMESLIYQAMGACCLLYVVGQYGQARLIGRALSESITLRFENLALIERLEAEKEAASVARERAEQANQAKSRFLAAASHDLRQPIHALGLFLEALSSGPAGTQQKSVLDNAKAASLASTEMLNTLLDFSRIEAGVIQPKPVPCRIQLLLHKLERELAPQADAKGLAYRTRDSEATVLTDPAMLELILRNLIANAIRYTDRGGLLIGSRTRGSCLSIEVFDTGIGIAADQQGEVFREFHQLGNPERDRRKGLGLGLAIAQGLAKSLKHPLSLVSRLGRGSVFRVAVPLASEVPSDRVEQGNSPKTATLDGRRLLVIDDDETVRLAMQELLTRWGCESVAVESLDEALRCDIARPDLIVCDYRLRERQTGDEVIGRLRAHYAHPVPALLVTGDTAPERLREAMTSGVALLHKPVAPDQLWMALSGLLSREHKVMIEPAP
ncbi:hypothetical protein XthCFBP4691_14330 [Xanthomonas theicola]|uniref:histidine kinase n=2 Tax=Xanthomonas theicola TaxID=56464 RepID=A0A2S6ZCU1_9XANT|nr:hypothetical protein XthCFBP4691_14330 [Xanthomonas theicola]QNH26908.1 response regulator [Xanthomonas theicola]